MKDIERRLAALERATVPKVPESNGARQRLIAKIEMLAERLPPVPDCDLPAIRAALAGHPIIGRVVQ